MKNNIRPFHLAIPVNEIPKNRAFYRDILGCSEGRSSDHWVDFDFFGHQLVIHLKEQEKEDAHTNPVDGKDVPVPHFGVVLTMEDFKQLSESLREQNIKFIIDPYIRFEGEVGEQATMFFKDPSGNALEFKAFKNLDHLFAK
ncbi:VOC family protein [Aureitalea sp. L0-47]|uniref:VOC family protein n=1 Tax=Aureitalea sp. L0-47 TaxID=2816962 RepID=UPI002237A216|nr:VOC family protein [Aureitalea sp. L0-47]MCW5520967.1 VOC family protein [Aureitalea sp. L0-47]